MTAVTQMKKELRVYARTWMFREMSSAADIGFVRRMSSQFAESFKGVSDEIVWKAVKADLPKLNEINRDFWPRFHVEADKAEAHSRECEAAAMAVVAEANRCPLAADGVNPWPGKTLKNFKWDDQRALFLNGRVWGSQRPNNG